MNDDSDEILPDFSDINFLAAWRFGYSAGYASLAIAELTFGRSPEEAVAAFEGGDASAIRLILDSGQAAALSEGFAAVAERLRAAEEAEARGLTISKRPSVSFGRC